MKNRNGRFTKAIFIARIGHRIPRQRGDDSLLVMVCIRHGIQKIVRVVRIFGNRNCINVTATQIGLALHLFVLRIKTRITDGSSVTALGDERVRPLRVFKLLKITAATLIHVRVVALDESLAGARSHEALFLGTIAITTTTHLVAVVIVIVAAAAVGHKYYSVAFVFDNSIFQAFTRCARKY